MPIRKAQLAYTTYILKVPAHQHTLSTCTLIQNTNGRTYCTHIHAHIQHVHVHTHTHKCTTGGGQTFPYSFLVMYQQHKHVTNSTHYKQSIREKNRQRDKDRDRQRNRDRHKERQS